MSKHEKINYIELPAHDMAATKAFFEAVFDWKFTDYGPDYVSFENAGIDGGFSKDRAVTPEAGALLVFYSAELEKTQAKIEKAGGAILKPIFLFPGGRRFHFSDPNGNEFAVWSDQD